MKTNAARILDIAKVKYELREYDVTPEDLSAATVAQKVGMALDCVYKTLVCRGDRLGPMFAVVSGDKELDLKRLAVAAKDRKCQLTALKEVQPMTGYIRGGVTVLGAKKAFPVFVDSDLLTHDKISVSAGTRGLQILLAPADYVKVTAATLVDRLGQ